jgi:pyruvate-ferredoxin/flavodoxin oxidoreductase
MVTGINKMRTRLATKMQEAIQANKVSEGLKANMEAWLAQMNNGIESEKASSDLIIALKNENTDFAKELLMLEQYFVKKSVWIIGGDGWAYDIGYGGLDHVIASGEDVNILVLDTEVYSNTGGQASKSTPAGAVAKFAASGKRIRKKDLGMMAISYGYAYVAQVALGSSQSQFFNAIKEAEAYRGPSIIIAYSPCINHGISEGMGRTQHQEKFAVESGYWTNYRYNPLLEQEGKNPFTLDSKEPDWNLFQKFINSEVRYTSLKKSFPKEAEELFAIAEENAKWRYKQYKRLAESQF